MEPESTSFILISEELIKKIYNEHGVPAEFQRLARQTLVLQHYEMLTLGKKMARDLHERMFLGESSQYSAAAFTANTEISNAMKSSGQDCIMLLNEQVFVVQN